MSSGPEVERAFLERVSEYLVSLPFDLKVLQEAIADPDLDKSARVLAACTVMHTLLPQEGEPGPIRYVDDVLYVRAALDEIGRREGSDDFRGRFQTEIYGRLEEDIGIFSACLGELWPWLTGKLPSFSKLHMKGKRAEKAVDDEEIASLLYDEGLAFQTNYTVNEEQVRNKVRRVEPILELFRKRYEDDKKKIG